MDSPHQLPLLPLPGHHRRLSLLVAGWPQLLWVMLLWVTLLLLLSLAAPQPPQPECCQQALFRQLLLPLQVCLVLPRPPEPQQGRSSAVLLPEALLGVTGYCSCQQQLHSTACLCG